MKKEYLIYKLSEDLKEATRIENELFRKFDVKRGLRNGPILGYSKAPWGLSVLSRVTGIFTGTTISPGG